MVRTDLPIASIVCEKARLRSCAAMRALGFLVFHRNRPCCLGRRLAVSTADRSSTSRPCWHQVSRGPDVSRLECAAACWHGDRAAFVVVKTDQGNLAKILGQAADSRS